MVYCRFGELVGRVMTEVGGSLMMVFLFFF
jgi:hypothetical protein